MQTTLPDIVAGLTYTHPRLGEVVATGAQTRTLVSVTVKSSNTPATVFRSDLRPTPAKPAPIKQRPINIETGRTYSHAVFGDVLIIRPANLPGCYYAHSVGETPTEILVNGRYLYLNEPTASQPKPQVLHTTTPVKPTKPKTVVIICNKDHKHFHTADTADAAWKKLTRENWSPRKCREYFSKQGFYSIRVKL